MSAWRREALSNVPELQKIIEAAESPMSMWIELHICFDRAVRDNDSDLVRRILRFADWCTSCESGELPNDASTAASVAFYEHLPMNREYWKHFTSWISRDKFSQLLPVFSYHLSEEELEDLKRVYNSAN